MQKFQSVQLIPVTVFLLLGVLFGALGMMAVQGLSTSWNSRDKVQRKESSTSESGCSASQQSSAKLEQSAAKQAESSLTATRAEQMAAGDAAGAAKFVECTNPASLALEKLGVITETESSQLIPGQVYSETSSGYPIVTGSRAVDWGTQQVTYVLDQQGEASQLVINGQPVGRNGLISNPCVDPASTKGLSYSRSYPVSR